MADEGVLKEFLVRLGYRVDQSQQSQFTGAIRTATMQSQLLADSLEAAAVKVVNFARSVNEGLEQLYWASFRTKSSVENIRAFSFAMSNLGIGSDEANQALESASSTMRSWGTAGNAYMASLIGAKNVTGDLAKDLRTLGKVFAEESKKGDNAIAVMIARAGALGITQRQLIALGQDTSKYDAAFHKAVVAMGINYKKASADAKAFMDQWRGVGLTIELIGVKVASELNTRLAPDIKAFNDLLLSHSDEIVKFIENMVRWFEKVAGVVNTVVEHLGGWDHVIKGIILLKLEGWALGVAGALFRVAASLVAIGEASAGIAFLRWLVSSGAARLLGFAGLGVLMGLDIGKGSGESLDEQNRVLGRPRGTGPLGQPPGTWGPDAKGLTGVPGDLAGTMEQHLGQSGPQLNDWLHEHNQQINAAMDAWCGAFVEGALESAGIKGLGGKGLVATNWSTWGVPTEKPERGDVAVLMRGLAPGQVGGHVGSYTGKSKTENGETYYEIISGNKNGAVCYSWEKASDLTARHRADAGAANNPLALQYNPNQPGVMPNGRFGRYASIEEGIAAAARQMMINQDRYHLTTLRDLIGDQKHGWAPANANDTPRYVATVARGMNVDPDAPINVHDPKVLYDLIAQQAKVEGRNTLTPEQIRAGIKLQFDRPGVTPPGVKPLGNLGLVESTPKPDMFDRPIMPAAAAGGNVTNINMPQNTTVNVTGAADPHATANAVERAQDRVNQNLVRHTRSAVG